MENNETYKKNQFVATELANKLDDEDSLGCYINLATTFQHEILYEAWGFVKDYPNPKNRAALFMWYLYNEKSPRIKR